MGSLPAPKSIPSEVNLIPWDPDSPEHVERMFQQRVACGWRADSVESWRQLQRDGKIALQWITLADSGTERDSKLSVHLKKYPSESTPIKDTAMSLAAEPRSPSLASFTPVGHISLDSWNEDPSLADGSKGLYRIMRFYVSSALQGSGLGSAAMDTVERMAASEPLYAKQLSLATAANEYPGKEEKRIAMQREPEKFSIQDWYARRGYEAYQWVDEAWWETDPTGKPWPATAVMMKKDIQ